MSLRSEGQRWYSLRSKLQIVIDMSIDIFINSHNYVLNLLAIFIPTGVMISHLCKKMPCCSIVALNSFQIKIPFLRTNASTIHTSRIERLY